MLQKHTRNWCRKSLKVLSRAAERVAPARLKSRLIDRVADYIMECLGHARSPVVTQVPTLES